MNVCVICLSMTVTLTHGGAHRFSKAALYPAGRSHTIAQHAGTRSAVPSPVNRAR